MRSSIMVFLGVVVVLPLIGLGCAELAKDLGGILESGPGGKSKLDEPTVAAGIREALRVGAENTVESTSSLDGFLGNELIRIAVPDQLEEAASALRRIGLGSMVDELEVGMNRAAELAAAEAREVFAEAIAGITIEDAFGILKGQDTAATEYFRERAGTALRARFHPIVEMKMETIGLSRDYARFAEAYNNLPLADAAPLVDLDEYVTDRALGGLFTVLEDEERRIRRDPMARTTELLRKVFGRESGKA